MTEPVTITPPAAAALGDLECITRSPGEPAPARYLAVCTGRADLIARSRNCVDAERGTGSQCGGHAICRPCFDLAVAEGRIVPDAAP